MPIPASLLLVQVLLAIDALVCSPLMTMPLCRFSLQVLALSVACWASDMYMPAWRLEEQIDFVIWTLPPLLSAAMPQKLFLSV